ncbi:MAG: hypothetical protein ACKPA7_30900 [Sphaerospermopsis kisseleviana]
MIIPSWAYKPAKKFQGSLLPTCSGFNYGYQEQVVKAWELPTPATMGKKELKKFRRFIKYLKTLLLLKQLTKLQALQLLKKKYYISLTDAKQLIEY